MFLLSELISVHRVLKGGKPYWRGAIYQINRNDLARQFACEPDDVSAALHWLRALGVVDVIHRTRIDDTGKPSGTEVFAFPLMDRIQLILDFFVKNGCPMSASQLMDSNPLEAGLKSPSSGSELTAKKGSSLPEQGAYLNCAQPQQKLDAENGGETFAQRQEPVVNDDRGSLAAGGGGAGDADIRTQTPPRPQARQQGRPLALNAPMPPAAAHGANNPPPSQPRPKGVTGTGHVSNAPPARWTPAELPEDIESDFVSIEAWRKACVFCQLWAEAIVRQQYVTVCKPTLADRRNAFEFFHANPQTRPFYSAAVAISAWLVADAKQKPNGWDRLFSCRQAREIKGFIRAFTSGKLESEIGQLGWKINTFEDLRSTFTESELTFYGFSKIPVLGIDPEILWENQPSTPNFYKDRNLRLPPEVVAANKVEHGT